MSVCSYTVCRVYSILNACVCAIMCRCVCLFFSFVLTRQHFPLWPSSSVSAVIEHHWKSISVRHLCALQPGGHTPLPCCFLPCHFFCQTQSGIVMDLLEAGDMGSGHEDENCSLTFGFSENCLYPENYEEEPLFGLIELGG